MFRAFDGHVDGDVDIDRGKIGIAEGCGVYMLSGAEWKTLGTVNVVYGGEPE